MGKTMGSIALIMVMALSVGFLFNRTGGFESNVKDFYLIVNDSEKVLENGDYDVIYDEMYKFEIHHDLESFKNIDFSIYIMPNISEETNFAYEIGNKLYNYYELEKVPLINYFDVKIYSRYFTLRINKELIEVMESIYSSEITGSIPLLKDNISYIKLLVENCESGDVLTLNLNVKGGVR